MKKLIILLLTACSALAQPGPPGPTGRGISQFGFHNANGFTGTVSNPTGPTAMLTITDTRTLQPLSSNLTSISALTVASFGLGFLTQPNSGAALAYIGGAADANLIHTSGNESKSGTLTFNNPPILSGLSNKLVALDASGHLGAVQTATVRGLSTDIYFAIPSGGNTNPGTGTSEDPYEVPTSALLDGIITPLISTPNITLHFRPGIFLTKGSTAWIIAAHGWKIEGSGMYSTTLRLDPATAPAANQGIAVIATSFDADAGASVSELTVDCNYQNIITKPPVMGGEDDFKLYGVFLYGDHNRWNKVRVINAYGSWANSLETFDIGNEGWFEGGTTAHAPMDNLATECVAESPRGTYQTGIVLGLTVGGGHANYGAGNTIYHSTVNDYFSNVDGPPMVAFSANSVIDCTANNCNHACRWEPAINLKVIGNQFLNCRYSGVRISDIAGANNVLIDGNTFQLTKDGVFGFVYAVWIDPTVGAFNITVSNNTILSTGSGSADRHAFQINGTNTGQNVYVVNNSIDSTVTQNPTDLASDTIKSHNPNLTGGVITNLEDSPLKAQGTSGTLQFNNSGVLGGASGTTSNGTYVEFSANNLKLRSTGAQDVLINVGDVTTTTDKTLTLDLHNVNKTLDLGQSFALSTSAPSTDGQVLAWNATNSNYEPRVLGANTNLVFVDAVTGNDTTGAVGSSSRPFLTIGAASTAATGVGSTAVILLGVGAWSETVQLGNNVSLIGRGQGVSVINGSTGLTNPTIQPGNNSLIANLTATSSGSSPIGAGSASNAADGVIINNCRFIGGSDCLYFNRAGLGTWKANNCFFGSTFDTLYSNASGLVFIATNCEFNTNGSTGINSRNLACNAGTIVVQNSRLINTKIGGPNTSAITGGGTINLSNIVTTRVTGGGAFDLQNGSGTLTAVNVVRDDGAPLSNSGVITLKSPTAILTFSTLNASPTEGDEGNINDGKTANCADGTCTTFGTAVTGGGGALHLKVRYNGTAWTLAGI